MSGYDNGTLGRYQGHSPLFQNVVFQSNQPKFSTNDYYKSGGAVYAYRSTPSFRDVTFKYNTTTAQGGAIYIHDVDTNKTIIFERTIFTSNHVEPQENQQNGYYGGAVYLYHTGKVVFKNCVFDSNSVKVNYNSQNFGGAVYASYNYDSLVVRNTKFRYNKVYKPDGYNGNGGSADGGAINFYNGRDHFLVSNSVFIGNESLAGFHSYAEGGGYNNHAHAGAIFVNMRSYWSGTAYSYPHRSIFINNTFVDNKAEGSGTNQGWGGALHYYSNQSTVLINNNFWGNTVNNYTDTTRWEIQDLFNNGCLVYTSPSPRDLSTYRMRSSA